MKTIIKYADFEKLDLRVGQVVAADLVEWSNKLIRYEVDFGEEIGRRVMFSGIKKWYKPRELENKKFVFVVNMERKKMGPEESDGMMLMFDTGARPVLMPVDGEIESGTVVR